MTFERYSQEFTTKANDAGYSSDFILKCLHYAKPLIDKGLPVIYNSTHFSSLVGYEHLYLMRAITFTRAFYRTFLIPKKNGEQRVISEPLPSLKSIQSWVLKNILYSLKPSKFAKAYIPGVGLKQNLVFHKGQQTILKLDIKDFFSSIGQPKVKTIFLSLGYSDALSDLFSKLCCLNGFLPQGAPTSAYLSNLFLLEFDNFIAKYCIDNKIRYTRYSDDLFFSGDFEHNELISIVKEQLTILSLTLNEEKIKVMKRGVRQVVTGVVVNDKLQVDRKKRNKIRQAVYYIKKYGLDDHLRKINCRRANYLSHLIGQVLYVLFVNPDDDEFKEYKLFLSSLKR